MSADLEARFRRLLAWFPHVWRAEWEEVALGSLLDDAEQRHLTAPTRAEAWGLRLHGLVERAAVAVRPLSVAGLAVVAVGAMTVFLVLQVPALVWLGPLCASLIGPLLIATVVAGHGYRADLLSVRGAVLSLVVGASALTCRYLAGQAWSVGIDEADAGRPRSWFAAGFVPLALSGLALGTTALLPLALGVLRAVPARTARLLLAVLIAGAGAVTVAVGLVIPTSAALAAAALVVPTCRRTSPPAVPVAGEQQRSSGPGRRWSPPRQSVLTGLTAVAGAASALFAFTGSSWRWYPGDGTQAMNLGLAAASLAAVPLLSVLGNLLRTGRRYRRSLAPAAMLGGLAAMAVAQGTGAGSSMQLMFLLVAGGFTGLAVALLALPLLPQHPAARAALTVGLTVVAFTTIGLPAAVAAPVAAPAAAIVMLLVGALGKDRRGDLAAGAASA